MNYSFKVYDFSSHSYVSERMNLLLPIINQNSNANFIKHLKNNKLEISLKFMINIPYKNKNKFAIHSFDNPPATINPFENLGISLLTFIKFTFSALI